MCLKKIISFLFLLKGIFLLREYYWICKLIILEYYLGNLTLKYSQIKKKKS